jgi:hypothetical protein
MQDQGSKSKWRISTESVYSFGREERLQTAYEIILPSEKISLKGEKENVNFETSEDRVICASIK